MEKWQGSGCFWSSVTASRVSGRHRARGCAKLVEEVVEVVVVGCIQGDDSDDSDVSSGSYSGCRV